MTLENPMTIITFNGSPLHTIGELPKVGTEAPDFILTKTDLSEISLKNCQGKKVLLNIFPSLDTSTCGNAMRQFNTLAEQFKNIMFLCISADLPFAQKRFCTAEHLQNVQPVSVFRHPKFGQDYGVTILDGPLAGLLSRAVLILDTRGIVIYTQQVQELSNEPDYSAMMDALGKS
jgi:thiol peroxidase